MDLPARVTAWRESKGWTQAQLAAKAEVSRASICQIEGNGKYTMNPSQKMLKSITDALGVSLARFWGPIPKAKKRAVS